MATHDYVIANGTGAAVRSDLNDALAAIVSNNSGSSEPATTYAYQWWADTTANVLKIRNSANNAWITLRELDGTMLIEDGSNSAPGLSFASDTNTGFFSGGADKIGFATGGVERLEIGSSEVVFNDPSNDVDFRVESNGNTHMLFVDAGNDRVGIGTTSPGVPLQINTTSSGSQVLLRLINENATANNTAGIQFGPANGVVGAAIYGLAESDFSTTANRDGALAFHTRLNGGGIDERARIDSSGRLLVGTSSSSASTAAVFQGNSFSSGQPNQVYFQRDTAGTGLSAGDGIGFLLFADNAGNVFSQIACQADAATGSSDYPGRLTFSTTADDASSPTERMRIDSSGNVQVSSGQFTVGTTASTGLQFINDGTFGTLHSADLKFRTVSAERMRIDSSGRLLVGTTSALISGAEKKLQMTHANAGAEIVLGRDDSSVSSGNSLGAIKFVGNDGGTYQQCAKIEAIADGTHASNDKPTRLAFSVTADGASSPTERMRIESGGIFKVADDPSSSEYFNASVNSHSIHSSYTNSEVLLIEHSSSTDPFGITIDFTNDDPDDNSNYFLNCKDSTTNRLIIYSDGDVKNHDNSYGSLSDQKLKQDIVDAGSQWDDIKDLRVRKFKFKSDVAAYGDDAKTLIGLVAQEAELVSPGLVKDDPDLDNEQNDLGTVTKSIRYSVLYMKAVKALQEAMARIETLEAKVAALEAS